MERMTRMYYILRKLTSRILWVTIVGIVVGIAAAVNYVHAEGLVDKASAVPIIIEAEETDTKDE